MKKQFLILVLLGAAPLVNAQPVPAASTTAPVSSPFVLVQKLISQQQWQAAQIALQDAAQDPAADPIEVLFLGGMIAIGNQNYGSAIAQFQKILIDRPDIPRVRLELARAYFLAGDDDGAQYHFERVLAGDLPPAVVANVEHFLSRIRARRNWQLGFNLALLPDSNINQATSAQTVVIGGLPFTLSSDARETSGIGLLWQLNGEKRWDIADRWRFGISGNLLRKDYSRHQFNDTILYARIGPRYLAERGETSFGISLGKRLIGDKSYSSDRGIFLDINRMLAERWLSNVSLESRHYSFVQGKGQPGTLNTVSGKLRYLLSPVSQIEGGLDLSRDTTISAQMRHRTVGVSLGLRSEAPFGLVYGVSLRRAQSRYPSFQPFFNQFRNDVLTSLTVDVTKRDWKILEFSPVVSLSQIHNRSTIPFYSFHRTLGQFGFNRQF